MRLGLPYAAIPAGPCLCGALLDSTGYHLLSGCKKGNERQTSHNAIRDSIAELCITAGLITRKEDSSGLKQLNINTKQRMDIVCDNFKPGIPLNIDTSIIDIRQQKYCTAVVPAGKAALDRENEKNIKYLDQFLSINAIFMPFILESHGRWGLTARKIFSALIDRVMQHHQTAWCTRSQMSHYWKSRITMSMHRAACRGIHKRIVEVVKFRHLQRGCAGYQCFASTESYHNDDFALIGLALFNKED
jgi:hypothetical protein